MADSDRKFEVKEIVPSAELKALLKQARRATGIPDYVGPVPFPVNIGKSDLSLMLILDTKPSCRKALIKKELQQKIADLNTYIDEQIQSLPDRLAAELLNAIFKIMDELIDQLIAPYDSMINGALHTYNRIVRLFRKIAAPGITDEDKERYKIELINTLRKIAQQIPGAAELIALIMLIECMKSTAKTLRDAKKASADDYSTTAEKIKTTQEVLDQEFLMASEIIVTIVYIFKLLLPIILALAAIFTTGRAFDQELNEKTQQVLEEQNSHNEGQLRAKNNKTEIERLATDNLDGFSYIGEKITPKQPKEPTGEDFCHSEIDFTNLCPQESPDIDGATKIVGAFIELDPNSNYSFTYSKQKDIKLNDTIGEMDGIKIMSPVDGNFRAFDKNIGVVMFNDESLDDIVNSVSSAGSDAIQQMLNGAEQSEVQQIVDKFEEFNKAKTVLREYGLYCKIPAITTDLGKGSKPKTLFSIIYADLINKHDRLLEDFQNDTEYVTGKDHVEEVLNGPGMDVLKKEIMALNDKFYRDVINAYHTYLENRNYRCDRFDISSFRLLSYYIMIKSKIEENNEQDDKNEYVTEFKSMIEEFISRRLGMETVIKSDYLESINAMCDITLKAEWIFAETYVEKFESIYSDKKYKDKQDPLYSFLEDLVIPKDDQTPAIAGTAPELPSMTEQEKEQIRIQLRNICTEYTAYMESINRLDGQSKYEATKMNAFFEKLEKIYYESLYLLEDNLFDKFKKLSAIKKQNVFYNGQEYEHYYVENKKSDDIPLMDDFNKDQLDLASSSLTSVEQFSMKYWLRYCLFATITHCAQPMYWSCGIIAAGVPIMLPVIYVPIYYLGGSVGCLFGLGICGMFIWPMILCVNFNMDARTILMPINMIIDLIRSECNKLVRASKFTIKDMAQQKANSYKREFDSYDQQIDMIEVEILKLKQNIGDIGRARKERKKLKQKQKEAKKQKTEE